MWFAAIVPDVRVIILYRQYETCAMCDRYNNNNNKMITITLQHNHHFRCVKYIQ